jgi:hypothetical protein
MAFDSLLYNARRMAGSARAHAVCEGISALASGPRETFMDCIRTVVVAAVEADPSLESRMDDLISRVRGLLAD